MPEFAECVVIGGAKASLNETETYFVKELFRRIKQIRDSADSSSHLSRKKVSDYITDNFNIDGHSPQGLKIGIQYMSDNLRNQPRFNGIRW